MGYPGDRLGTASMAASAAGSQPRIAGVIDRMDNLQKLATDIYGRLNHLADRMLGPQVKNAGSETVIPPDPSASIFRLERQARDLDMILRSIIEDVDRLEGL